MKGRGGSEGEQLGVGVDCGQSPGRLSGHSVLVNLRIFVHVILITQALVAGVIVLTGGGLVEEVQLRREEICSSETEEGQEVLRLGSLSSRREGCAGGGG